MKICVNRDFPFGCTPSVHPASDTYLEPELVRFVGRLSMRRCFTPVHFRGLAKKTWAGAAERRLADARSARRRSFQKRWFDEIRPRFPSVGRDKTRRRCPRCRQKISGSESNKAVATMLKVDTINPFFVAPNKSAWGGGNNCDVHSPIAPIQVPRFLLSPLPSKSKESVDMRPARRHEGRHRVTASVRGTQQHARCSYNGPRAYRLRLRILLSVQILANSTSGQHSAGQHWGRRCG